MNITVLGAGAIGSLWAYKLTQAGHKVSVWTKRSESHHHFITLDGGTKLQFVANNTTSLTNSDLLLITVKVWQVKEALIPLLPHLDPDTILLFMHNGMGAVEEIQSKIDAYPVLLATTTHGAYRPESSTVSHTGVGTTQLGAFNSKGAKCEFLTEVLQHALPTVDWNPEIKHALWNKLAVNCAINPLTAIHQITNGKLAETQYKAQLESVIDEVTAVMGAEKIPADKNKLTDMVHNVIKATASNYSSMQQDIHHQRRSEIDYINGYLCRIAGKHAIDTPENLKLYNQIKHIELSWKTP